MNYSILFNCPKCQAPICQRAFVMNLAFGHDEEQLCLPCLANSYELPLNDFFERGLHYVKNRKCFLDSWNKMISASECPCPNSCAINLCFEDLG